MQNEMSQSTKHPTGPKVRLPKDGSGTALSIALISLGAAAGVVVLTDDLGAGLVSYIPISIALLILYGLVRRLFGWPRISWAMISST
jgi:hypothetical protein